MKAKSAAEANKLARIGASMGARRAAHYLTRPEATLRLLDKAVKKAERRSRGPLKDVWDGFKSLVRLTRAYATRKYTRAPWKTMLSAMGALVYFVSPVDLIPDFIIAIGLVDDAAVIGWVVLSVKKDLEEFREWEAETGGPTTA